MLAVLLTAALLAAPIAADASAITYDISGYGVWQVAGNQSLGAVSVVLNGDTSNVTGGGGFSYNSGTAAFTFTPTFPGPLNPVVTDTIVGVTFVLNGNTAGSNLYVPFPGGPPGTLYMQILDPSFGGQDLTMLFGPLTVATNTGKESTAFVTQQFFTPAKRGLFLPS